MKKCFTYFIAILLFGLCILEKESSSKDLESEIHLKNDEKIFPVTFDYQNITSTDSVSFYLGKEQDKIF